jgi:hypothetical protein
VYGITVEYNCGPVNRPWRNWGASIAPSGKANNLRGCSLATAAKNAPTPSDLIASPYRPQDCDIGFGLATAALDQTLEEVLQKRTWGTGIPPATALQEKEDQIEDSQYQLEDDVEQAETHDESPFRARVRIR